MEKRRILEVMGEGISHGGEEAFISNLISNIDTEGLVIDWLTPYSCNNMYYADVLKSRGGTIYELGLSYTPGKNRNNLIRPLNRFFSQHKYDVVHIHSGSTSALALIAQAACRGGIKNIIVHSHTAGRKSFKSGLIKKVFSPMLKRYPTRYLACSNDAAKSKFPDSVLNGKVVLINNGIDLGKYKPDAEISGKIRKSVEIPSGSRVIGHVGRFSEEKNHRFILESFKKVLEKETDCYLMLVGDGSLLADIKQTARELDIDNRVRFTGYVNNAYDYYKAMDLFVMPSLFEGFPIAALEAQAAGVPCIISDRIDKSTAVNPNVYMLSIEKGNEKVWAETICKHINDKPINDQTLLTENGFDIKDTCSQVRALYLEN